MDRAQIEGTTAVNDITIAEARDADPVVWEAMLYAIELVRHYPLGIPLGCISRFPGTAVGLARPRPLIRWRSSEKRRGAESKKGVIEIEGGGP